MATITFTVSMDASVIRAQLFELKAESMALVFPENIMSDLASYVCEVGSDLVLGDGVPAPLADGSREVVYTPRLGGKFETLLAALRAYQIYGIC